jgi:hypothetical protein
MVAYRVKQLATGAWVVKLGVTTLSRWPSDQRQQAIDSAIERAKTYWLRTPTRFKDLAVFAPDEDGVDRKVWTAGP